MTAAKMAAKLTAAGVRYVAHDYDGVIVLEVPPRLEWDRPVQFFCCGGRVRCEYHGQRSIRDGMAEARVSGVRQ